MADGIKRREFLGVATAAAAGAGLAGCAGTAAPAAQDVQTGPADTALTPPRAKGQQSMRNAPFRLATSGTLPRSASRRILTICSSVKRPFLMVPSLVSRGHPLKNQTVRKSPGRSRRVAGQSSVRTNNPVRIGRAKSQLERKKIPREANTHHTPM